MATKYQDQKEYFSLATAREDIEQGDLTRV